MKRGVLIRNVEEPWRPDQTFGDLFPGGHALVFGSHRVALDAEDVGFEVRDCIMVMGLRKQDRCWLLRRPVEQQNVAQQVLKTGTGALWIDGCRVRSEAPPKATFAPGWDSINAANADEGYRPGAYQQGGAFYEPHNAGRWPPNLVFVHGPECREQGTKTVASDGHHPARRGAAGVWSGEGGGLNGNEGQNRYLGSDGLETVASWSCQQGCPVAALDQQSGNAPSSFRQSPRGSGLGYGGDHHDSGGSSRFFPQFANDQELDCWLTRLILGPEE